MHCKLHKIIVKLKKKKKTWKGTRNIYLHPGQAPAYVTHECIIAPNAQLTARSKALLCRKSRAGAPEISLGAVGLSASGAAFLGFPSAGSGAGAGGLGVNMSKGNSTLSS
jgi:hypothetical protein